MAHMICNSLNCNDMKETETRRRRRHDDTAEGTLPRRRWRRSRRAPDCPARNGRRGLGLASSCYVLVLCLSSLHQRARAAAHSDEVDDAAASSSSSSLGLTSRSEQHNDGVRSLQLSFGPIVDKGACYSNLHEADSSPRNGILSPSEYLTFVQLSANGELEFNEDWGVPIPITDFSLLPKEYIGIYNTFACGSPNVGCPSVEGINIDGVADVVEGADGAEMPGQQEARLFQLCKAVSQAVNRTPPPAPQVTPAPTFQATPRAPSSSPTASPTPAVTAPPSTPAPPAPTSSAVLPPCPPLYVADNPAYSAGDLVSNRGGEGGNISSSDGSDSGLFAGGGLREELGYYRCKPYPMAGWCVQGAYEPGNSQDWDDAWTYLGQCVVEGGTAVATSPPTREPTHSPSAAEGQGMPTYPPTDQGDGDTPAPMSKPTPPPSQSPATAKPTARPLPLDESDPPYSGPIDTTFQYEVYNTLGHDSESIETDSSNGMMDTLTKSTAEFVAGVVSETFGSGSAVSGNGPEYYGGVDHDKGNEHTESVRYYLVGGGGSSRGGGDGSLRRLVVLIEPDSVTVTDVEDVPCSDPSLAAPCQKVTATARLNLIDEPKLATELQLNNGIARALDNGGVPFPDESGIVYAGRSAAPSVSVIPEAVETGPPPSSSSPPQEGTEKGGTPGWVVPVSIGAAAVCAVLLVLLVGHQVQKRKRDGIQYQGHPGSRKSPREEDLMGDMLNSPSYNIEIQQAAQSKISPLDADLPDLEQGGIRQARAVETNPFLHGSSSSRSSRSSGSSSSGGSVGSFSKSFSSSSSSSSTSSSQEDLANHDPKEYWKREEQEDFERQMHPKQEQQDREQPQPESSWRLQTVMEASAENLTSSQLSLMSASSDDKTHKSVYRAGVEALVKEACPERTDQIDEMMAEYEGREEVLIGHLSTMLANKNRQSSGYSEDASDGDDNTNYSFATDNTSAYETTNTSETPNSKKSSLTTLDSGGATQGSGVEQVQDSPDSSPTETADAVEGASPASPVDEQMGKRHSAVSAAVLAAGSASAAAVAAVLADPSGEDTEDTETNASSNSSSAGSSEWSSDDGFSSIDTSSLATNETPTAPGKVGAAMPAAMGDASAVSSRVTGYRGSGKPTFIPVDSSPGDSSDEEQKPSATRKDLDDAIQAGDWKAVGATAALIAGPTTMLSSTRSTGSGEFDMNMSDLGNSRLSISSHERNQVEELEQLVEAGNWEAVMAAATRFETASDTGSLTDSKQGGSMLGGSMSGKELSWDKASPTEPPLDSDLLEMSPEDMRAEIVELVRTVVPDELDNLDEMLTQFSGREEELVMTLRTMRESIGSALSGDALSGSALSVDDDGGSMSVDASSQQESQVSVFESDISSTLETGARNSSFIGSSSSTPTPSEGSDSDRESNFGDGDDSEELQICTSCSRRLPRSEYTENEGDDGRCNDCLDC